MHRMSGAGAGKGLKEALENVKETTEDGQSDLDVLLGLWLVWLGNLRLSWDLLWSLRQSWNSEVELVSWQVQVQDLTDLKLFSDLVESGFESWMKLDLMLDLVSKFQASIISNWPLSHEKTQPSFLKFSNPAIKSKTKQIKLETFSWFFAF